MNWLEKYINDTWRLKKARVDAREDARVGCEMRLDARVLTRVGVWAVTAMNGEFSYDACNIGSGWFFDI